MVDEVIKAKATVVVNGVSLTASSPTLTLKDTSQATATIKSALFSSTAPQPSVSGYGLTPITTIEASIKKFYAVVVATNVPAGYLFDITTDSLSTILNTDIANFDKSAAYRVELQQGQNNETICWLELTTNNVLDT